MRKSIITIILASMGLTTAMAQERTVQNRPYTDLRKFHFGVFVGTHLQDLEFKNVGPQMIEMEDGTVQEKLVVCDQDRWDPGFNVGVLGELRLHENFQFRIAPAMYFGTRHLIFRNYSNVDAEGNPKQIEEHQDLKTAYVSCAFDLIFAAPRFNNYRPYMMAGINPMLNLSGRDNDFIKLKKSDVFLEVGLGCDFYLPFFKLRPELKFMLGITNNLDTKHADNLRDKNMIMYSKSVSESYSKMFVLTFFFE